MGSAFPNLIRKRRAELCLTLDDLARSLGRSRSSVHSLERCLPVRLPPDDLIRRLASVLELPPDVLRQALVAPDSAPSSVVPGNWSSR